MQVLLILDLVVVVVRDLEEGRLVGVVGGWRGGLSGRKRGDFTDSGRLWGQGGRFRSRRGVKRWCRGKWALVTFRILQGVIWVLSIPVVR